MTIGRNETRDHYHLNVSLGNPSGTIVRLLSSSSSKHKVVLYDDEGKLSSGYGLDRHVVASATEGSNPGKVTLIGQRHDALYSKILANLVRIDGGWEEAGSFPLNGNESTIGSKAKHMLTYKNLESKISSFKLIRFQHLHGIPGSAILRLPSKHERAD
ncbi:hypothetical protein TorRG33x02_303840 [Trema orientale]|uniref:Uncharacterized protein n=1 Tax=Trema orientale TaxID=63057 RepID=A0A2P5BYV7_TREOI|nr:hypothetical protein TorRG33x02_303840 [Trema orientale]